VSGPRPTAEKENGVEATEGDVMGRTVVWFSAGAASAVAAKLTLAEIDPDAIICYTDPGSEHPDNERFLADCEQWFGKPIQRLKSERYEDTWQVWSERRFLVGPQGALCTTELKKMVRFAFERPTDRQVFGYTADEQNRADRFCKQNPGVTLLTPLIDYGLDKPACLAIVERAGIELPEMYKLGYLNNNCIGCVKGGIGYWNKIRRDFPETFWRMAGLERGIGHSILKESVVVGHTEQQGDDGEWFSVPVRKNQPLWLDKLDPTRGRYSDEPDIECGLLCQLAEEVIEGPTDCDETEAA
jgi:hypothetical protein